MFSRRYTYHRWNKLRHVGGVVAGLSILVLVLGTLAACNSSPAHLHVSSSTKTVPAEQSSTVATGPTPTTPPVVQPTATPNPTVLQVDFTEQYTAVACTGAGSTPGTTCVTSTGTGQDTAHGSISLSRTSVYAVPGSDSCSSASTQGTLTLTASGDTVTFTGTGTFCGATQIGNFTYTIAGGTGTYLHATGSGSIHVPLPSSSSTGTESWSGTLLMS